MYKSEQLALNLKNLIDTHIWQKHEKLPSLRQQAKISGLSLITVMNAYKELEAQGLIYSKEKLGYFVAEHPTRSTFAKAIITNNKIEVNSLVFKYLKSIQSETVVPLGSAFPDSKLLYSSKLVQNLAQQAKYSANCKQIQSFPPGNYKLRKIIAQRYCMEGIPTDPSDIVITSGGLDALNLSLRAMTQVGDYILLQDTIFYGAWQIAENLGLKVITIPTHPECNFDIDAFKKAICSYPIKVCLLMLNSHNPIGFTVSHETKLELAKVLNEHKIYLIEDDVYGELYFDENKPASMKFYDKGNMVLHCSSFSKTLGSNFRIGWVHAGKFSEQIQHLQLMSTISVNPIIQNSLVAYLSHRYYEQHLKNLRSTLKRIKQQYYIYLSEKLPKSCTVHYYASGYFLWITLPQEINSHRVYEKMIQNNIGVAPSIIFSQKNFIQNHIRINCSFEMNQEIVNAIDILVQDILNSKRS